MNAAGYVWVIPFRCQHPDERVPDLVVFRMDATKAIAAGLASEDVVKAEVFGVLLGVAAGTEKPHLVISFGTESPAIR